MRRRSLSQRVTLFTTLGLAAFWAMAVLTMSFVLWSEQEELFDQQLIETAHVLLPVLSQIELSGTDVQQLAAHTPRYGLDEALVVRLIGRDGAILRQSSLASGVDLPAFRPEPGRIVAKANYLLYTTPFNTAGHALQLAAPMAERREAYREGLVGFLLPMLALLPLTYLMVGWLTRRSLMPLNQLREEIAGRDGSRLDTIDAGDWPEDLVQIVGTLNGFMARLSQALDGERAFATNAAHELRTPVAIALAQVQQLREAAATPEQHARIEALERALQRMRRLVARLLQLARADAGVGVSAQAHDLLRLTRIVLDDVLRGPEGGRIDLHLPAGPVMGRIDPDAFAIVLGNLVDNALQHAPPGSEVRVTLMPDGVIEVENAGPAVPSEMLATLPRRFGRHGGEGFGLGLHICQQILAQAEGGLDILSPAPGRSDGFLVRATL